MLLFSTQFDLDIDNLPLASTAGPETSLQLFAVGSVQPGHCDSAQGSRNQ